MENIRVKGADIKSHVERVGSGEVLRLRGKLLPLVRLADVLGIQSTFVHPASGEKLPNRRAKLTDDRRYSTHPEAPVDEAVELPPEAERRDEKDLNILVLKVGEQQYGLVVDEILDLEEIVVKPLSSYLKDCRSFAGATIMGDGKVSMVLDVNGIADQAKLNFADSKLAEANRKLQESLTNDMDGTHEMDIILFSNAENEYFAAPLSSIQRLEKFETDTIETIGHREFLNYRGRGLPLGRLEQYLPITPSPIDLSEAYLILPQDDSGVAPAALVASQIIDSERVRVKFQEVFNMPGVIGSAVVKGHLTTFVEPRKLLEAMGLIEFQKTLVTH